MLRIVFQAQTQSDQVGGTLCQPISNRQRRSRQAAKDQCNCIRSSAGVIPWTRHSSHVSTFTLLNHFIFFVLAVQQGISTCAMHNFWSWSLSTWIRRPEISRSSNMLLTEELARHTFFNTSISKVNFPCPFLASPR